MEVGHQAQLNAQNTQRMLTEVVGTVIKESREDDREFVINVLDKVKDIGPKQITASAHQTVIIKHEANAALFKFMQRLKAEPALDDDFKAYMKEELEEIKADIKAGKTGDAKSKWEVAWQTARETVDFASKFPKLFELAEIVGKYF